MEDREKAKIKLIIWGILIGLLIIFLLIDNWKNKQVYDNINNTKIIDNSTVNETQRIDIKEYDEIKKLLNGYNYEYTFVISNNSNKIKYFGKVLYEEIMGYKEEGSNIKKYYINENNIYDDITKNSLLGNIDNANYDKMLDFNNVLNIADEMNMNVNDHKLIFNNETYNIMIENTEEGVIINILYNNIDYNLKYYNFNKLTTIE